MAYPKNYSGIAISEETHQRLTKLRDTYNEENYDAVINKLIELEEKFNPKTEIYEYEYQIKNGFKLFRITFDDLVTIEYYNYSTLQFEKDITAWFTGDRISDKELDSFVSFIVKNSSIIELYEMNSKFSNNDIVIYRVNN